ncbi:hypothetical protein BGZ73_002817 [Actinomortierella ambigua]|nr:hypothetical protein BGZ73_002817 [Actinomortierella ambigua]
MQNDATSIRTFRTGLLARRAGFATAAHASTTGKSEDPTAAARGAFAPKSKNLEEASSSAAMEKSSFAALSVLSGATGAGPSTTTTTNSSVTRPVAVPRRDDRDNPFLQRPARKLFKHDTMSHGDTPSTSAGATTSTTSNTTANKATSNSLFSMPHSGKSTKTVAPKPNTERLTLTRVMPLNSPTKPGARSTVSVTRHQEKEADRPTAFSLFGQLSAPSKMTTPATLSGNIVQEAHGSTTPTMTPNPKYFEALDMNQAVPVPKLDFSGLEKGKGSPILRRTDLDLPDKGQEEEKGPAGTAASATYSSTTLAFARKSIMKHARAKPQTVLQSVARAAEEHEGSPLYSTLLSASTYAPRFESSPPTSATSQALAVNTPAVSNSSSKPPTALSSNSATTSKWPTTATSQKNSDTSLRPTPTAPAPAPTPAPAPIRESRAVLDFSGRTEPEKTTATATQTVPVTTRPGSLESQEQHEKPSVANEHPSTAEKTGHSQSRFDLRAALLSESSRSKYELPALTAREAPELTGRASKTAPYQVPSAEERRELRANRRPGYKALPLNPKRRRPRSSAHSQSTPYCAEVSKV